MSLPKREIPKLRMDCLNPFLPREGAAKLTPEELMEKSTKINESVALNDPLAPSIITALASTTKDLMGSINAMNILYYLLLRANEAMDLEDEYRVTTGRKES